jgi:DNA polymerase-3 subunit gamma/tau
MKKIDNIVSNTLYRKYRPETFGGVLGQSEVVTSLQNSIVNRNIAHAYLFSGGRGSGKTSVARIFSKELGVSSHDIYEIDAASNRGIDQIRDLRSAVETLPLESEHKVYIIDEVHMLTKEAFNALLKTLEEPPKHVIFILATTEKHKVLDTIISRCQLFEFRKGGIDILKKLIMQVAKSEKVKIDDLSVEYIAALGGGSFRDTLSHLQKSISIFGSDIVFSELEKTLSNSNSDLEMQFISALAEKNNTELSKVYAEILVKGMDIDIFAHNLLEKVRIILLIKNSTEFEKHFANEFSKEQIEKFKKIEGLNSLHLKKLLEILDTLKKSEKPEVAFEIFLHELIQ